MPNLTSTVSTAKRPKHRHDVDVTMEDDAADLEIAGHCLIPGIPDHVAQLCLSLVPPSVLRCVSRSWRQLIYSPCFPPFLSLYALLLPIGNHTLHSDLVQFRCFDPISCRWISLPLPPPQRFLFRHPSFISRNLPVQSVAVSGSLVVLAATNDEFLPALSEPVVFNPLTKEWSLGPTFSTPRRWCAAGALEGTVYLASGIGAHFNNDVARSVEKWNLIDNQPLRLPWIWKKMAKLKDGKFSREAIDAVGWRGKLCMVNVKGDAAKEGIIYDVASDVWTEMPEGMLAGWKGPAAAMDEETIYVVDESKGSLKKYDHVRDTWEEIVVNDMLKGGQHMAAAAGKVCVVCGDGGSVAVVDVVAPPPVRLWKVDGPDDFQVTAVHILPRLCGSDFPSN